MSTNSFLIDSKYLLKKFPGKGGWTYAEIPEIAQNKSSPFGWVKVSGFIDDYELNHHKLMPMGNGKLFLSVKSAIRKKIKKQAGEYIFVKLNVESTKMKIPDEILECFSNEPKEIYETFSSLTEGEQKEYLDWIEAAKTDKTKVDRIVKMLERLSKKMKLRDKIDE